MIIHLRIIRLILDDQVPKAFFSPELDKKVLPAIVSYKTAYYSLGALIIYCLFGSDIKNKNIDEILLPIKYSKLYWFLKRCLDENPKNRYLIYV